VLAKSGHPWSHKAKQGKGIYQWPEKTHLEVLPNSFKAAINKSLLDDNSFGRTFNKHHL
jgi:hypothetical protein